MTKSTLASVLPTLCAGFLLVGCPDDATEGDTNNNEESTTNDEDSDPDTTVSVTLTTDDPDSSSSDPTTTTDPTVDPDSSTDPTEATESSSTDPTEATESSSTDPTEATESSSSTDPTDASSSSGGDTSTADCADVDLNDDLPVAFEGNNAGFGNDVMPSCTFEGGPSDEDVIFEWTAPEAGEYQIDTLGSALDTELVILDECGGDEVMCSEDVANTLQSGVVIELTAGQTILIVVDGFDSTDDFVLNINEIIPNMGEPWGDCFNGGELDVQAACDLEENTCVVDNSMAPTGGVCSEVGCTEDADCYDAPPTGTAAPICRAFPFGNACVLDCSGGETCPDGMECFADIACIWPD